MKTSSLPTISSELTASLNNKTPGAPQVRAGPFNSFTFGMGSMEVQNPEMDIEFKRKKSATFIG